MRDSLSSKFDFFVKEDNNGDFKFYTYITVIDEKLDDNYTLTIDGKEYKPLIMEDHLFPIF